MQSTDGDLGHAIELDEGTLILQASDDTLYELTLGEGRGLLLNKG